MPYYKRNGYKWSIPEILRLQREFELLELNIEEISRRHQRTPFAIANRLVDEGFASQECKDVSQYLGFIPYNYTDTSVSDNNMSLSISEDEESRSDITNDSEDEISTLKSQVSDLNTKLDSILSMLKRSNGGSVIGIY
jgi:hypothetical protein